MSDIESLRKSLALSSEGLATEDKKKMAVDAITTIIDALGRGVGTFGEWEQRCLAASIITLRAGKYDDSRDGRSGRRKTGATPVSHAFRCGPGC